MGYADRVMNADWLWSGSVASTRPIAQHDLSYDSSYGSMGTKLTLAMAVAWTGG
jgi:hypothetical protein